MKAWYLDSVGNMNFREGQEPSCDEGWTLVKVKACGICGSDIPRAYTNGAHKMPLIIGHEFSGQVVSDGRRVGIFPLIPCGKCGPCLQKKYEMCRSYNYLGSRCDGGFAEYAAVPSKNLIDLPDNVSYRAAAMLEPMAVAVHACRQLGLLLEDKSRAVAEPSYYHEDKNARIVICGVGTIGMLTLMFLLDAGYENIYVIGNRDIQREKAKLLGLPADRFCDTRTPEGKVRAASLEADIFFECVGKQETYEQAINQTAPAGRVCLVGNPYSDMALPRDIYWKILRNQLLVTGTWNSSFTGDENDDWHYVVKRLAAGLDPERLITHSFDMEYIEEGFHIMRDKSEDYIKVMMTVE